MNIIYSDSSTREACIYPQLEGQDPIIVPYDEPVTENVGEYRAVTLAITFALMNGLMDVEFRTDSRLVVEQVAGRSRVKAAHLKEPRDKVRELLARSPLYKLVWVPREENLAGKVLE